MTTENMKPIVSAVIIIAVNVAAMLGFDIDGEALTNVVCAAVMLIATGYGVWKNHNFTDAARQGQELTDAIKNGGVR